jgi:Mn2+/Fe2+ NRAMP family transporter
MLVAIGMLGAVGGSLMNLVYPYSIEQKGWRGPQYRKLQRYDFMLGVIVMIVLDLAIWTVGAELLYGRGETIQDLADLSGLVSKQLGQGGNVLFYLGVFAAVYTSIIGHALGLGLLSTHAYLRWQAGDDRPLKVDYRNHPLYRWIAIWILVSPLVWTVPGMPGFVRLTLIANSAQVVLVPLLGIGLFWITASSKYIGAKYKNRWWENVIMVVMLVISVFGFYGAVTSVWKDITQDETPASAPAEPGQSGQK